MSLSLVPPCQCRIPALMGMLALGVLIRNVPGHVLVGYSHAWWVVWGVGLVGGYSHAWWVRGPGREWEEGGEGGEWSGKRGGGGAGRGEERWMRGSDQGRWGRRRGRGEGCREEEGGRRRGQSKLAPPPPHTSPHFPPGRRTSRLSGSPPSSCEPALRLTTLRWGVWGEERGQGVGDCVQSGLLELWTHSSPTLPLAAASAGVQAGPLDSGSAGGDAGVRRGVSGLTHFHKGAKIKVWQEVGR